MQDKPLKVLAFRVNEHGVPCLPYMTTITDSLEEIYKLVHQPIQVVHLTDEIDLVCCDEGKLIGLPPNRAWVDDDKQVLDVIVGDFFLCRHKNSEFTDIKKSDLELALGYLVPIKEIRNLEVSLFNNLACPLYKPTKEDVEKIYPKGSLLYLYVDIDDPYSPKPAGSIAKVEYVDDALNIHVKWYNQTGNIAVIYGKDFFFKLPDK